MQLRHICILCITLLMCIGCSNLDTSMHPSSVAEDEAYRAEILMSFLFASYERYERRSFASLLALPMISSRDAFLDQLEDARLGHTIDELSYTIRDVQYKDDFYHVQFAWEKSIHKNENKKEIRMQGNAECVFARKNSVWYLYAVKGESPF